MEDKFYPMGRTIQVIRSCKTKEQVYTATNYIELIRKQIRKEFGWVVAEMYTSLAFHLGDLQIKTIKQM